MQSGHSLVVEYTDKYTGFKKQIKCCDKVGTNKVVIPCIFNGISYSYDEIQFPKPKIQLYSEQRKVISETYSLIDHMGSRATYPIFWYLHPGFGKTYTALVFAAERRLPIFILHNSDAIKNIWLTSCRRMLGVEPTIASGSEIGKHDILICSIRLLMKHNIREGLKHYGTVIVDEADSFCCQKSVRRLVHFYPRYFIGMSGTVNDSVRARVLELFWGSRNMWICRNLNYDRKNMDINILYTGRVVETVRDTKGVNWQSIVKNASEITESNILIRNLCLMFRDRKIFIVCTFRNHVKTIFDLLQEVNEDVNTFYGTQNGYVDARVIVGTRSKGGRGADDKTLAEFFDEYRFNMLIFPCTMKNCERPFGRSRSSSTHIYILCHNNNVMKSHIQEIKKNYRPKAHIYEHFV